MSQVKHVIEISAPFAIEEFCDALGSEPKKLIEDMLDYMFCTGDRLNLTTIDSIHNFLANYMLDKGLPRHKRDEEEPKVHPLELLQKYVSAYRQRKLEEDNRPPRQEPSPAWPEANIPEPEQKIKPWEEDEQALKAFAGEKSVH